MTDPTFTHPWQRLIYRQAEFQHMGGFWTYILALIGGRRYVGYSRRPGKRISAHFSGGGASFTGRFRPTGVVSIFRHATRGEAKRAERSAYLATRRAFGKSKVRGAGRTRWW